MQKSKIAIYFLLGSFLMLFFNNCSKLESGLLESKNNSASSPNEATTNENIDGPGTNPNAPSNVTIDSGPNETATTRTAQFVFSLDTGSTAQCRIDQNDFQDCTSPTNYTDLAAGVRLFEIKAVNEFGESEVTTFNWTIDAQDITPPQFDLINPPLQNTGFRTAFFKIDYRDNLPGDIRVRCRLDGAPFTNCQKEVTYYDLGAGPHTWTVVLTDIAGNTTGNQNFNWNINTDLPDKPEVPPNPTMSFFISSRGIGDGNLGGLAGADQFCQQSAQEVGAGGKTWRAYLSVNQNSPQGLVNARDRIGSGPWFDFNGAMIALNVTTLHANGLEPVNMVDEEGTSLALQRYDHDILTGSNQNGTLRANRNCQNWTSNSNTDTAMVGHTDWKDNPPYISNNQSWNQSHNTRCDASGMKNNLGEGKLYCFATD